MLDLGEGEEDGREKAEEKGRGEVAPQSFSGRRNEVDYCDNSARDAADAASGANSAATGQAPNFILLCFLFPVSLPPLPSLFLGFGVGCTISLGDRDKKSREKGQQWLGQ